MDYINRGISMAYSTIRTVKSSKNKIFVPHQLIMALALALPGIYPHTALAQQDLSTGQATWLDTITVTGTRTETPVFDNPATISVVDQQTLEKQAPESIAAMLRDIPSLDVIDSSVPGMKRIRIRGESSHRVTILVDGQEITDHSDYGTPLLVDTANVERIDVIRGPASVLYGAKAIGGVINIITKRGSEKPVQLELGSSYYSGTHGAQGWMALSGTMGEFDYRISASADRHHDRIVPSGKYTGSGRLDGSRYRNSDVSMHLGYKFGADKNHYLALKAEEHRLSTDSWTDPSNLDDTTKEFRIDLPKRNLRKIGLHYDARDLGDVVHKVHADVYYQTVDRQFANNVLVQAMPTVTINPVSTSDDKNINYGGTVQLDLKLADKHYTIAGVQYLMDDLDTRKKSITTTKSSFPFIPSGTTIKATDTRAKIQTSSIFAQDEWFITDNLALIGGLRYYNVYTSMDKTTNESLKNAKSKTTGRLVKSLGLTWTGIENTTLRALYSEGYTMPSLMQLYADTTAGGQGTTRANPGLKPETSQNYEIGARYANAGLVLDTSAFYTKSKDYIGTTSCNLAGTCAAGYGANDSTYINVNSANTHGIELVAQYSIANTGFTPYVSGSWLQRQLNYASFSTRNSGTPSLSGRFGVKYDTNFLGSKIWSDLFVRTATAVKQTSTTDKNQTERLAGWGTLNFAIGASAGKNQKYQVGLELNNLLNKEYRSAFDALPGTGRSAVLTMRATF